jgi:tRNA1(Val) A37 N6-methylase TrmN6
MFTAQTVDFAPREARPEQRTPPTKQAQLGQFLSPSSVAGFMAAMFGPMSGGNIQLLDAGAGAGALSLAFAQRWQAEKAPAATLALTAYELDEDIHSLLGECLDRLGLIEGASARLVAGDFLEHAASMIRLGRGDRYTHAILNPPYKKINTASLHRQLLRAAGLETVNLYSGFVGLSLELLAQGGELVAIIPRSFCNGP